MQREARHKDQAHECDPRCLPRIGKLVHRNGKAERDAADRERQGTDRNLRTSAGIPCVCSQEGRDQPGRPGISGFGKRDHSREHRENSSQRSGGREDVRGELFGGEDQKRTFHGQDDGEAVAREVNQDGEREKEQGLREPGRGQGCFGSMNRAGGQRKSELHQTEDERDDPKAVAVH